MKKIFFAFFLAAMLFFNSNEFLIAQTTASFGNPGDLPIAGDWNGDGKDEIGVYRPSNSTFWFDLNGSDSWDPPADVGFGWGNPEDSPIAGDWNGDGKDEIGVVRAGVFFLDLNGSRTWDPPADVGFGWGNPEDLPIAGDWNGDGKDEIGVYRQSKTTFYLDYDGNRSWNPNPDKYFGWGETQDLPFAGDFNGDGKDEAGTYRTSDTTFWIDYNGNGTWDPTTENIEKGFYFGNPGDQPIAGDFGGNGKDEIATFSKAMFYFQNSTLTQGCWKYDLTGLNRQSICQYNEVCVNQVCVPFSSTCKNDCVAGAKECGGGGWRVCGNFDNDPCFEWSNINICEPGKICENGSCANAKIQKIYYVSPDGDDNNSGLSESQPFKTIEKARATIRLINSNMTGNIIVYLRGGEYLLQKPLVFDQNDSGTNGYEIIYRNYSNETPVISGGQKITGWVSAGQNKWKASVGNLQTRQLFIDGIRQTRARSAGYPPPNFSKTATGFTTTDLSMQNWRNISDIEFISLSRWKTFRCGAQSILGTNITIKNPCWTMSQAGKPVIMDEPLWRVPQGYEESQPGWVENAYELLDQPGEWYLDRAAGQIYYQTNPGQTMDGKSVVAAQLETLLSGSGNIGNPIKNVHFEGITFADATWLAPNRDGFVEAQANVYYDAIGDHMIPAGVNFTFAENIIFKNCKFTRLGAGGLSFYKSNNILISQNEFSDISGNGLIMGNRDPNPSDLREATKMVDIANNRIHNAAVEYPGGHGIWLGYVRNCNVVNNEIYDLPYSAISAGWGWGWSNQTVASNRIADNYIHDHCKTMVDCGGIYTLGSQPGVVISGNFITGQVNNHGAIYLDEGSRNIEVYGNVVFGNKKTLLLHQTGDNYLHDNWWQVRTANDLDQVIDFSKRPDYGPNALANNHIISSLGQIPAAIIQNAGVKFAGDQKELICNVGAIASECMVCKTDGSAWQDDNSKCGANQTCQNGICVNNPICAAKTCATLGNYQCGDWPDGCGGTINCGICASGKTCSNGQCTTSCTSHASKKCDGNILYWYNSCNTKEGLAQNCATESKTCRDGACVSSGGPTEPQKEQPHKLTRAEILTKIAQIKQLLIQLIMQLIAELQKQLAAMG